MNALRDHLGSHQNIAIVRWATLPVAFGAAAGWMSIDGSVTLEPLVLLAIGLLAAISMLAGLLRMFTEATAIRHTSDLHDPDTRRDAERTGQMAASCAVGVALGATQVGVCLMWMGGLGYWVDVKTGAYWSIYVFVGLSVSILTALVGTASTITKRALAWAVPAGENKTVGETVEKRPVSGRAESPRVPSADRTPIAIGARARIARR